MSAQRFRVGQRVRAARRYPSLVAAGLAGAVGEVVSVMTDMPSGTVYVGVYYDGWDRDDPWLFGDDDLVIVEEGEDGAASPAAGGEDR